MAERVKVKLNYKGVGQLLKSSEMQALLAQHAGQIAGRCGSGYETDGFVAQTRAVATVYAATRAVASWASVSAESYAARKENADTNSILKALK